MFRFVYAVALFFVLSVAHAGSAVDDMLDDALQVRALQNVAQMTRGELDALTEVLAACAQISPLETGMPRFYCNKELIRYQTSGSKSASVDRLLLAAYSTARLLAIQGSEKRLTRFDDLLKAHIEVFDSLLTVAGLRAIELAGTAQAGQPKGPRKAS